MPLFLRRQSRDVSVFNRFVMQNFFFRKVICLDFINATVFRHGYIDVQWTRGHPRDDPRDAKKVSVMVVITEDHRTHRGVLKVLVSALVAYGCLHSYNYKHWEYKKVLLVFGYTVVQYRDVAHAM